MTGTSLDFTWYSIDTELGMQDLLCVIQAVVAGHQIADCDGRQVIGHALISKQFKAYKE